MNDGEESQHNERGAAGVVPDGVWHNSISFMRGWRRCDFFLTFWSSLAEFC